MTRMGATVVVETVAEAEAEEVVEVQVVMAA